jgi:glycosyltransferase involved in cell wall biosynthesis
VAKWQRANNLHFFSGPFYLCYQRGLLDWLESWNPDMLIVEANPRHIATPAAVGWMHARNRSVIGWGLGATALSGPLAGLRSSQRTRFLKHFDALIAYSQRGATEYRALGFREDKVFVAANAVASRPNNRAPESRTNIDRPVVLYVGRLQARKRIYSLLRACASLPPKLQPRLQIVGEGPALAKLEALAASIYPQTRFAGQRFGAELDSFFDQADLFVLPGTGGLAVQQAMAHGLPVIVAEGDGSQEDMVRPGNGWLLPPGDETALRAALTQALSDPTRLRKMGALSFQLVQQTFNLENMANAFVDALNAVS